ncbi:hypothetical protein LTR08_008904 [Meristemomyces frigidus]|nr:hypothetical protein LTR08_008904 [Meristemomyces frigidus]
MSPPGRRRSAALSLPTVLVALLFLFTSTASAAGSVLGLDFGTLNLKAALVKPGIPLEIVLSKDSKRKETAAVAFKPNRDSKNNIIAEVGAFPERAYGGDALALHGRFPGEVFPNLKTLLERQGTDGDVGAVETYKGRYPSVQAEKVAVMGTTMIKSSAFADSEMPWSVEELLAMELANVKRNAEVMAGKGSVVEDVVITVPAFYTADEKRAIEKAAVLAGLTVHGLISDGLAVGLDYAKSRTFPDVTKGEKPEYHVVFDMGAGSTTATLLRFQAKSVKDTARYNKTVQELAVLGTGWDSTLGGDSLNQVILDDYVHKFLTKPVMKSRGVTADKIKSNGRLMARMWKEVEKTRQVLSANTETSSSFEELLPEIDFRTKLSRTDFEKLAEPFAARVAAPINQALAAAKLTMADIDSIILHGGMIRTPFVQRKLEEIAGGSAKLRSNVNADESAVFGAAFKGAGLSPSFKVKEIRDSDIAGYEAGMSYTDGGKERKQGLFSATSPVGNGAATKQVSFKDKEDFAFELYQVINGEERPTTRVQTDNLTASVKELNTKFGCEKGDVSTKFSIKLSSVNGLPEVIGGTVSCEVEGTGKKMGETVKDWFGFGGKKDQDPLVEGDDGPIEEVDATVSSSSTKSASSGSSSSGSAKTSSTKVPEKPKKRIESIPVTFATSTRGNPQPGPEEIKRMRDRLAAFDRSDHARLAREEAMNVLESYTYFARDFLGNTDYSSVSTAAMMGEVSKLLDTTREFMESPGQVAKATEEMFREKLSALKLLVQPIQNRRKEELARPEKVKALKKGLEDTQKLVVMVRGEVEKASTASSKASEMEVSKSAADAAESATAVPSPKDEFEDLEDADTTSPTTTTAPKYSSPADFSPYSDVDLKDVEGVYDSVAAWLKEKEAAQDKLKPYEQPALYVKDIDAQAAKLSAVVRDLTRKKSQKPKPTTSSKKAKTSKTKSSKKAKSSTTEAPSAEGSASASGKPNFMTIKGGEEMPSEEEILRMVRDAKGKGTERDEL